LSGIANFRNDKERNRRDSLINGKHKLLIALACSLAVGNDSCVNAYTRIALKKGISRDKGEKNG